MIDLDASDRWQGLDGLGDESLQMLRRAAEMGVRSAAMLFKAGVQETLTGGRSGRTYIVSRTGRPHIASRAGQAGGTAGEPPAVLTGLLRRSIAVDGPTWDGWTVFAVIGTNVVYARRLEYGGVHTTTKTVAVQVEPGVWRVVKAGTQIRILPRPFFEPTALRLVPTLERILEAAIDAVGG